MHFSLSLLSEYLNINEEISKKSPSVGRAGLPQSRGAEEEVALEREAAPACENSTAVINILELGICEIQRLLSGVPAVGHREFR